MITVSLANVGDLINATTAANTINNNFTAIALAFQDALSVSSITNNQLRATLDANSQQIINLPAPLTANAPLRLQDLVDFTGGGIVSSLPPGGTTGQALVKVNATNYNVTWASVPSLSFPNTWTAVQTFNNANLKLLGASTGGTTFASANAGSTDFTLTIPAITDNLVTRNSVDTFTNKTYNTASTGNIFQINGTGITAVTGTGAVTLANTPTLITPVLGVATATSINKVALTAPAASATLTIANTKTLTANNSLTLAGTDGTTLTFQATDTYVGRATTDTLTNKTINGPSNTLTNIALSSHATQAAFTFVGNNTSGSAAPTAVDIATLTTKASPAAGDFIMLSDQAATGAWKKATVSSVASAGSVSSIAGNTGAFTLANGIGNTANQIELTAARRTLPTVQTALSGSGTYTTPANVLRIRVRLVGGGGGGAGSGSSTGTAAGVGGNTTFGTTLLSAGGGAPGAFAGAGGAGGTASLGTGPIGIALPGGYGGSVAGFTQIDINGGQGGASVYGSGPQGPARQSPSSPASNTGSGGGGAGGSVGATFGGAGGGSGAFVDAMINSPAASYSYAVGAAGTAGGAGPGGVAGGAGSSGSLYVEEYYGS